MPSRMRRQKTIDNRFLFVNDTAQTRGLRDPERNKEKQMHVQRQAYQSRRWQKRSESTRSPSRVSIDLDINIPTENSIVRIRSVSHDRLLGWQASGRGSGKKTDRATIAYQLDSGKESRLKSLYIPGQFLETIASSEYPAVNTAIEEMAPESAEAAPFNNMLRARTIHPLFSGKDNILADWSAPLMIYYNTVLLPQVFFSEISVVPISRIRHAKAIHDEMAEIMSDSGRLYSFLASVAARMLYREGRLAVPGLAETDTKTIMLFFMSNALESVRTSVEGGVVTPKLLLEVMYLTEGAYYSSSFQAANMHFRAVEGMFEVLGGFSALPEYFRDRFIHLQWAASTKRLQKQPVIFETCPGNTSASLRQVLDDLKNSQDNLGSQFAKLVKFKKVPTCLADICYDLVETIRFARWLRQTSYNADLHKWLWHRHIALAYRVMMFGPPVRKKNQMEAFRIALIFWTSIERSPSAGKRCSSDSIPLLMWHLNATEPQYLWHPNTEWLVWIASIGGLCSSHEASTLWLAELVGRAIWKLGIQDFDQYERIISGFLYDKDLQRAPLRDFYSKVQDA